MVIHWDPLNFVVMYMSKNMNASNLITAILIIILIVLLTIS